MFDVNTLHHDNESSAGNLPPWKVDGLRRNSSTVAPGDRQRAGNDDDDRLDTEVVILSSRTNGSGGGVEPHRRPYSVASFPINTGSSDGYRSRPKLGNQQAGTDDRLPPRNTCILRVVVIPTCQLRFITNTTMAPRLRRICFFLDRASLQEVIMT
jgi:hypothetical protein